MCDEFVFMVGAVGLTIFKTDTKYQVVSVTISTF